jgi:hypothetical protein
MMKGPEKKPLFYAMVFRICTMTVPTAGLCATTGTETEVGETEEFWNAQ